MSESTSPPSPASGAVRRPKRIWLLLLLPFLASLSVPLYDRLEPSLGGIPFFYWYQLLWVALASGIVALVYRAES